MAGAARTGAVVERLVGHLFDGAATDSLADEVAAWLAGSPRFRRFAEAHRDKIRKKLRGAAADPEGRRDVRAELRAACLLLGDRRIDLAFEAYGSARGGPDFTVTFRGERPFNVEVTRTRRPPDPTTYSRLLLAKLRQLPPSVPNAILVAVEGDRASETADVEAAVQALRARADAKDEAFFIARGHPGSRAFYDRFLRLGVIFTWSDAASGDERAALWTNPSARSALPGRAARACLLCLRTPSFPYESPTSGS